MRCGICRGNIPFYRVWGKNVSCPTCETIYFSKGIKGIFIVLFVGFFVEAMYVFAAFGISQKYQFGFFLDFLIFPVGIVLVYVAVFFIIYNYFNIYDHQPAEKKEILSKK